MCEMCGSVNTARVLQVINAIFKCVYPLTSLHECMWCDPQAFPRHFRTACKQSKCEAREGLGTRLYILFAVYTSNPAYCQDYAVCYFLRLLQLFLSVVNSSCSWSIWTLYRLRQPSRWQQRHTAGSSAKIYVHDDKKCRSEHQTLFLLFRSGDETTPQWLCDPSEGGDIFDLWLIKLDNYPFLCVFCYCMQVESCHI